MEKGAIRLNNQQILAVMRAFDSTYCVRSITPVRQGVANPVFIVHSPSQDVVLRIFNPIAGDWKPKKEAAVYALLVREGIPVPALLKTDISKKIIPYNYALSKRLAGRSLNDAKRSASSQIKIVGQLGDYLGRMHALTFTRFGDLRRSSHGFSVCAAHELALARNIKTGPFKTWKAMHAEIVKSRLHYFKNTDFAPIILPIKKYFKRNEHLIDYDITPRLLHLDLNRGNVFIKGSTVTGILDVEESLIGHNEYDLMRTENLLTAEPLRNAFFKQYLRHISLDAGYETRRPFYALSRALVGVRTLILWKGHFTAKEYSHEKEKILKRINAILNTNTYPYF